MPVGHEAAAIQLVPLKYDSYVPDVVHALQLVELEHIVHWFGQVVQAAGVIAELG